MLRHPAALLVWLGASLSTAIAAEDGAVRSRAELDLSRLASEARQTIAVIDWFYLQNGACPQPSRPAELAAMERDLGDGFSLDRQGAFVAIRGISMSGVWRYYASPAHPDHCTLWRKLGGDLALIWRHRGGSGSWGHDPGDGSPERPFRPAP